MTFCCLTACRPGEAGAVASFSQARSGQVGEEQGSQRPGRRYRAIHCVLSQQLNTGSIMQVPWY